MVESNGNVVGILGSGDFCGGSVVKRVSPFDCCCVVSDPMCERRIHDGFFRRAWSPIQTRDICTSSLPLPLDAA